MEVFFFWVIFSLFVAAIANSRGRSGFGWFIVSILISPLISVIILALMTNLATQPSSKNAVVARNTKRCPLCAEDIMIEAVRCKHCGADVSQKQDPVVPQESEDEAARRLGIRIEGGQYQYGPYRYTKLADAIAYAKKVQNED